MTIASCRVPEFSPATDQKLPEGILLMKGDLIPAFPLQVLKTVRKYVYIYDEKVPDFSCTI